MNWVSIGSDKGVSPIRSQAIFGNKAGLGGFTMIRTGLSDVSTLYEMQIACRTASVKSGMGCRVNQMPKYVNMSN